MFDRTRRALARLLSRGASSSAYDGVDFDEMFEERAAVMEFDGGMTRDEAERRARADVERMLGPRRA